MIQGMGEDGLREPNQNTNNPMGHRCMLGVVFTASILGETGCLPNRKTLGTQRPWTVHILLLLSTKKGTSKLKIYQEQLVQNMNQI